jgi:hypothetical protein
VGYNIAYATHPYDQTDKQVAAWNGSWGYLTTQAPVIVTEFGSLKTCSGQYNTDLIAYADAHGASWVGWAWYPRDCTFPSLIADWQGTATAAGAPVKSALDVLKGETMKSVSSLHFLFFWVHRAVREGTKGSPVVPARGPRRRT